MLNKSNLDRQEADSTHVRKTEMILMDISFLCEYHKMIFIDRSTDQTNIFQNLHSNTNDDEEHEKINERNNCHAGFKIASNLTETNQLWLKNHMISDL